MPNSKIQKLRTDGWNPQFKWVATVEECADLINLPHEDYPKRVSATIEMIKAFERKNSITEFDNKAIHSGVMYDESFRGRYRDLEVRVGKHIPPKFFQVPDLIKLLFPVSCFATVEEFVDWYIDFETVHPYQDGNGRVGGIIVACLSHVDYDVGYLAPVRSGKELADKSAKELGRFMANLTKNVREGFEKKQGLRPR